MNLGAIFASLIVDEKTPEKPLKLVKEVALLLDEKEPRLKKAQQLRRKAVG